MAESHWDVIAHDLTADEKALARRVVIEANAPSADSAFLGAVRLIQMMKRADIVIPVELADPITTLDDWTLVHKDGKASILGTVKDEVEGRFRNGEVIHTSSLSGLARTLTAGDVIRTRNSRYRLGTRARSAPAIHKSMAQRSGSAIVVPR